ncbi:recombinase family protein [Paenibacillus oleatilyticus]|uniref:recombinase family protein n=1 Tax=Paenibacillus oleatilyticus TaxID=2594886 RepID=UPI001C20014A|nr:recombinase family protein [Paenibacillus oleatilyticus]MBU7315946.1 recombinase family protein [Paenibacillus oleatilyticus]
MTAFLRVWTLYRVSTKSQLTNDEIPTQRTSCRKYIETQPHWKLTKEVSENGVSAFKNKAMDRELLNYILAAAINKEFDILLIYKGDRLGRLFMDTTLYLLELFNNGVKTYSTVENYLNVETHASRLTTSIIFWQSEGESLSTSQRVSDFMRQYNEEGQFMGGTPPYGYKVIDTEIPHPKKDKTIKALAIFEDEAIIIREIFDLAYYSGFGSERIASYLNEHNYKTRVGGEWRSNVIVRLLRNSVYIGYKRFNTVDKNNRIKSKEEILLQPFNPSLVMIEEYKFWKVQEYISNRLTRDFNDTNNANNPTKGRMQFTGIAKCGYCGIKLKADYSIKYHTKKNGEVSRYKVLRYSCNNAKDNRSPHEIKYFSAKKFENMVEQLIIEFISKLDIKSFEGQSKKFIHDAISKLGKEINQIKNEILKKEKELGMLKAEVTKVIMGESKFSSELLQELILKKEEEIKKDKIRQKEIENELNSAKLEMTNSEKLKEEFFEWKDKYKHAPIEQKKMMYSKIIKELKFKKDNVYLDIALPFELK